MTCTCPTKGNFTYDPERDMWVHAKCRLPTQAELRRKLEEVL